MRSLSKGEPGVCALWKDGGNPWWCRERLRLLEMWEGLVNEVLSLSWEVLSLISPDPCENSRGGGTCLWTQHQRGREGRSLESMASHPTLWVPGQRETLSLKHGEADHQPPHAWIHLYTWTCMHARERMCMHTHADTHTLKHGIGRCRLGIMYFLSLCQGMKVNLPLAREKNKNKNKKQANKKMTLLTFLWQNSFCVTSALQAPPCIIPLKTGRLKFTLWKPCVSGVSGSGWRLRKLLLFYTDASSTGQKLSPLKQGFEATDDRGDFWKVAQILEQAFIFHIA